MLLPENAILVVMDVQQTLLNVVQQKPTILKKLPILIRSCQQLEIPVIWTEQAPQKIGATEPDIAALLSPLEPISKTSFSADRSREFREALEGTGRRLVILCGIETHICIYQTAYALSSCGYTVEIPIDAVGARNLVDHEAGLHRIEENGGRLTTVEMLLYHCLQSSDHPVFRDILGLVKVGGVLN